MNITTHIPSPSLQPFIKRYLIIESEENIEEATELAKACPVLPYGGSVEIREIPKPLVVTHNEQS